MFSGKRRRAAIQQTGDRDVQIRLLQGIASTHPSRWAKLVQIIYHFKSWLRPHIQTQVKNTIQLPRSFTDQTSITTHNTCHRLVTYNRNSATLSVVCSSSSSQGFQIGPFSSQTI
jgi:hypothetical protein